MQKCLFLDRDGVINEDVGYACKPEQITFMPGIFALCQHFQQQNYLIIIVTNQSGIARGYYSEADFQTLNHWLTGEFSRHGIIINDIFHCPHHPEITGTCTCRKPAPGMLLEAIKKYRINPQFSIMVGDNASDMIAARASGIQTRVLLDDSGSANDNAENAATHTVSKLTDIIELLPTE